MKRRQGLVAFFFLLPGIGLLVIFLLVPSITVFYFSFTKYSVIEAPEWVGFLNFKQLLLEDSIFKIATFNTAYYTLGTVPLTIAIGLILAVIVNAKIKFRTFFRVAFYLPVVTSIIAVSVIWMWLYNPTYGLLNYFLQKLSLPTQDWLYDVKLAMPSIILMSVWQRVGYIMILYLAGLQNIPDQLYGAAKIDGANKLASFWYITLPLLKPVTLFVFIITVVGSFQVFSQIYVMTGGGPANATTTIVHQLYVNAFRYFSMGYASAITVLLFLIIFSLSVLSFKFFGERES